MQSNASTVKLVQVTATIDLFLIFKKLKGIKTKSKPRSPAIVVSNLKP